jgi:hypothetical protein
MISPGKYFNIPVDYIPTDDIPSTIRSTEGVFRRRAKRRDRVRCPRAWLVTTRSGGDEPRPPGITTRALGASSRQGDRMSGLPDLRH